MATRKLRRLLVAGALASVLYWFISPMVTFGRSELSPGRAFEPVPASMMDRLDIVVHYFDAGEAQHGEGLIPSAWWVRLCYLSPQQAAVEMYDHGHGGDDFARLPWIFVPRFLFPEKPEMTVAGVDFNEKVAGFRTTSTGTGVFIDGYYNLGWVGFLFTAFSFGLALRIYANIAKPVLHHNCFVMYPLVFKGIHVALRADGWWLADVAGPLIFVFAALVLLAMFARPERRGVETG